MHHGGRKVFSATTQRGGKTTKSMFDTPGAPRVGETSTQPIDGSGWSYVTVLTAQKRRRSYLAGT